MRLAAALGFLAVASTPAAAQNAAVAITVDAQSQRHPIDPRIYGVNNGGGSALGSLNSPLNRFGGTFSSRYNWNVNAYNRGNDYYFESIVDGSSTAGATPDAFIADSKANGSEPLMTIPMVGWVAKVKPNFDPLCSFPGSAYPNQPDVNGDGCGSGLDQNGDPIPSDATVANAADVPADQTFQQNWIQHIIGGFDTAANGGLKYYGYDNEPAIWHVSHRDVHPAGAGMDEVLAKTLAYGHMIRTQDPNALLVGPEEYNWDGYFTSGKDIQFVSDPAKGCNYDPACEPDRLAHGDRDYVPWLLDQLHQHDVNTGERLLDVFAVHFYPQGDQAGHSEFVNNVDDSVNTATSLLRNRSTRSLWDPTYVDQSYIQFEGIDGGVIKLIPRLKDWASTYYPGTAVGVTEYSWGADNYMNGATTQADILGIFGREGLDVAARWEIPPASSPVHKSFQMYRNYDGAKSTFGDISVSAASLSGANDASDHVSAFAAERTSDGALTIMVVSKNLTGNTSATVGVQNFAGGSTAMAWRLQSNALTRIADVAVNAGSITLTLPPQSVTLLLLPPSGGSMLSVADTSAPEAAAGTTTAHFTVSLDNAASQAVTVDYATTDGTATAGLDYSGTSGSLNFAIGETEKTVDVTILGDTLKEASERFSLVLSNAVGATVARAAATGTIIDNASVPKIQFSAAAYTVSEAATKAVISVRRVGPATTAVGVSYAAYDGTATSPDDYTSPPGLLTFAKGVTTRTITIPIVRDTLTEPDETILLRLSDPTGGAFLGAQSTAILTVKDNDPAGFLSVSPAAVKVAEGGVAKLTVRRTSGANGAITVDYATLDGSAQDGLDYTGPGGTLTFAPGQTLQTITVPITVDGLPEGEEYFRVALSNATGGAKLAAASTAIVTIPSTDPAVEFLAPAYLVSEASSQASITVKRTGSLLLPLTVSYAASDGSGLENVDYLAASGSLTFAKGVATRAFAVKLVRDTVNKPARTVNLTLSGASVGATGTDHAVLTIKDDDLAGTVQFAVGDVTVSEGAGVATVKVTRTGKLLAGQAVDFATGDGTAAAGTSYSDSTQTLTFGYKEPFKLVTIPILDDGVPGDGAMTVKLLLGNPTGGAAIGPRAAAILWIVEDQ